jgi:3-oxoacyl-[acyl-carrier-protein] synthase II
MERVVVTGIGLITPLAIGTAETWAALVAGQSGITPITLFDTSAYRVKIAGEVKDWDATRFIERKKIKELDRFSEFAMAAAKLAIEDASLQLTDEERELTGTIIGVGIGGLHTLERTKQTILEKGPGKVSPYAIPGIISNLAAGQVSMAHGLKGPSFCTTSACSSGAHAIGEAAQWVRRGLAPVMIAGGSEATIQPVGIGGFEAMFALSKRNEEPTKASRPFDKGRDGFVSAEGGAVLILESYTRAKARGARIYAEVTGYGATSDAHHLTQPAPGGEGAQRAMRMALRDANLAPERIDYINAHGTSTPVGDAEESKAILSVFGARAAGHQLWVSSTKSMTGHLLGAAGALEGAIAALALHHGAVPPTINLDDPDPACTLDYVAHTARDRSLAHVLSNSFGFGGTNVSLAISKV